MSVLYRKYRPRYFTDVVGQNHIKVTLGNEIANGEIAHAYLFVGPRGTGKTTLARLFARAINCTKRAEGTFEPCNECESCTLILADRSLDIMEIDAATHTQVDNVRDNIIASVHVPPLTPNGYKVFIIDEIHMLSKHAFNALLKTLEEPPVHTVFILATTDVTKVPDTIISRCQRFDFKKIPNKLIIDRLRRICVNEKIAVPDTVLASVARRSEGCMRDAESLLGQVMTMAENGKVSEEIASIVIPPNNWQRTESLLTLLYQRNVAGALEFIRDLTDDGVDLEQFMADMVDFTRLVLLKKTIGVSYVPDVDEKTVSVITSLSDHYTAFELRQLVEIFLRESQRIKRAVIQQLPLELACIEFCQATITDTAYPMNPATGQGESVTRVVMQESQPDIQKLRNAWLDVLASLKEYNHSLSIFLKVAHPLSLTKDKLIIGFRYGFHAQTVQENKNRQAAEAAISAVIGRPVMIDCMVDSNYTDNHKNFIGTNEPEVQDVIDVMGGGEVV